jgi:hypothetical protein
MPAVVRLRAPLQRPLGGRSTETKRRPRQLVAGPVVVLAAIVLLVALLLGGGSAVAPPATGAAELVPEDALAYVHVSTDPSRAADRAALTLAGRFPGYPLARSALLGRLDAIIGASDFRRDVRPWLGKEAAIVLSNTSTSTAGSLILLDVSAPELARAFVARTGATAAGSYRGIALLRYPSGAEAAFVRHYVAVGQGDSVRAAIDVAAGASPSLASDPGYRQAAAGEPAGRVLDAYASVAGVRRVLMPRSGIAGALGTLLNQPALTGAAVSVSPAPGGVSIRVHSALNRSLAALAGAPAKPIAPSLASAFPPGSTLMLDTADLDRIAPAILNAGASIGIGGRIGPLLSRLGTALTAEGVDVKGLLSLFAGESALAVIPSASGSPALAVVARTRQPARASALLAGLETPLAQLFAPPGSGGGQAPVFNDRPVAGVRVHQLALAPGFQFAYTVSHGLVVISTSIGGVVSVVRHSRSLASDPRYRSALPGRPSATTSLLFLDFSQLLSLGEQTGLMRDARFGAFRADLGKLRAIGLRATSGEADSTAELFLQIS